MSSIITLTTDFGTGSPYVAQMKGVILSINPGVTIVDITHQISPQDVRAAALVLEDTTPHFPSGTVHIAVVDPGVGSDRKIVCATIASQRYIAPDNGLLSRLAPGGRPDVAVSLTNPRFWRGQISSTFHGRDVMAPVAAHLCLGADVNDLGPPCDGLVSLDWPEVTITPRAIQGCVRQIDSFGNLITNITRQHLVAASRDGHATVSILNHKTNCIVDHYQQQSAGSLVALIGSSGQMEVSIVRGNAAKMLGAGIGEPVTVSWQDEPRTHG